MLSNWRNPPRPDRKGGTGSRITGEPGKTAEDERVAEGLAVAAKRSNVRGAKGPCCSSFLQQHGRQGRYDKDAHQSARPEEEDLHQGEGRTAWRFWGLYVHVCKMETLHEAYRLAKKNNGAPGIDGVTFEAIEESGVETFLKQIQDELVRNTYRPLRNRRRRYPRATVRSASFDSFHPRPRGPGSLKLILEPIFEADFQPGSYGTAPADSASSGTPSR